MSDIVTISQATADNLTHILKDRLERLSKKQVENLAAKGLVTIGFVTVVTEKGKAALRAYKDAQNALARSKTAHRRSQRAFGEACEAAKARMTEDEVAAEYAAYRAARPGQQVGILDIGPDGKAFESCSWERLMSE